MKNHLLFLLLFTFLINSYSQKRYSDIDKFLISSVNKGYLNETDVYNYIVTDYYKSKKSDVEHFYFRQSYNGLEIVGTESGLHILPNGKLISSSNKFISNINEKIKVTSGSLSAKEAILKVAQDMNYSTYGALSRISSNNLNANEELYSSGGISQRNIPAKKIFFAKPYSKPVIAWELSIQETSGKNWYNFFVDANTGEILRKSNWTSDCSFDHNHTKSETNLFNFQSQNKINLSDFTDGTCAYNVLAVPLESPFFGPRTLEIDPHDVIASPFGWHDIDGVMGPEFTSTRGNNTNAYDDGDNPGYQPDGGSDLLFDFPFNPIYSFSDQSEDAAITNLFYWTNITHDILYRYGFDEASGNFQQMNYTGLGLGNDFVLAEAQDGSGSCNANFATPPDGLSGIMQMYVCGSRDGDFDNQVIIHEYGHGISNRLTGGPSNSDCLFNDEQMGEGWSDWYGSVITMTTSDLPEDLQPVGNWLFGQEQDGPGIRDFPYTTDISQDPRTYDYIKTTFGPHPLGSTWAAMLWELTWGLIEEHGFDSDLYNGTGGNNIALALVTESLKLQPCSPGFIDGRDAILAADMALYGGANQCIIWDAFAKRGLGFSAEQGSSFSRADGVEAFDSLSTSLETPENSFCVLEETVVLNGGMPFGGVYSGPGVTDNGDGQTYSFDPTAAGIGIHTITYTANTPCSADGIATNTIEVTDEQPVIECQDITITLDENGEASILPEQVVTNFLPGEGYSIDQSGTFDPQDISSIGSFVTLSDDQLSVNLPIGFSFTFFEEEYTEFIISSNGFITFNDLGNSGCCSGQNLPSSSSPNNLIAFAWDDLYPPGNGSIQYATIGAAPNRILIIDVIDLPFCCNSTAQVTSQVKIFEGTNVIEIHSADVNGNGMTQGIENSDGSEAYFVPERNSSTFNITSDFIAFLPNTGEFPSNCGFDSTVALDIENFNCSNIGENTVTATATDTNGNSVSCTSTVTVLPNEGVSFEAITQVFCEDGDIATGLTGGTPLGGVYSGSGVIDDGNGETFSFDPSVAGQGSHEITYTSSDDCGNTLSASIDLGVDSAIPDITCQDIEVSLGAGGTVTLDPGQLLYGALGSTSGSVELYAIGLNAAIEANIARYDYDFGTGSLTLDTSYIEGTQLSRNFAIDYNPGDDTVYILSGASQNAPRILYQVDLESPGSTLVEIGTIVSVNGSTKPQDMAFGSDGTLYIAFDSGEINSYDTADQSIASFATVSANGAVGLTYDYDNNRLLHTTQSGPVSLTEIDLVTSAVNSLFTFNTPGNASCSAQGIEYIGNNKVISSSTFGCDIIYTVDLQSQSTELLANPTGSFASIKDLLIINPIILDNCNGEPLTLSLDVDTFGCADIGENTVTVTAMDNQGNSVSCMATVTVVYEDLPELTCVENFQLQLDEEGNATLIVEDLIVETPNDCSVQFNYSLSKTAFNCNDLSTEINTDLIENGSFENELLGWNSVAINGVPGSGNTCNEPWFVDTTSTSLCCCVSEISPTEGNAAAYTSFDNNQSNTVFNLEQTIALPIGISSSVLMFDWLGEFDLTFGGSSDRSFSVNIYDTNEVLIANVYSYTIPIGQTTSFNEAVNLDLTDLLQPYFGETIILQFSAVIPEASTGPAKSLIDNVQFLIDGNSNFVEVLITAEDINNNIIQCTTMVEVLDPLNSCLLSSETNVDNKIVKIYPNPSNGLVVLEFGNYPLEAIDIYDINGRHVHSEIINSKSLNRTKKIDFSLFEQGVYILKLKSKKSNLYKRIILKK